MCSPMPDINWYGVEISEDEIRDALDDYDFDDTFFPLECSCGDTEESWTMCEVHGIFWEAPVRPRAPVVTYPICACGHRRFDHIDAENVDRISCASCECITWRPRVVER